MNAAALQILESFDRLSDDEKRNVASEIVRRSAKAGRSPLADSEVRIVRKGRLTIAATAADLPPLTEEEVLAVRHELRDSRSSI